MVREAEVNAAAVQIEGFAEIMRAHCGAFDVPARAAFAPGALPEIRAVFGLAGFPEREVGNVIARVFVGGVGVAGGIGCLRAERVAVEAGEFAVFGIAGDLEINASVGCDVGVPACDEFFDHRDLKRNVFNGARFDLRREHVERGAVVVKFFRPSGGKVGEGFAFFLRAADGFVVHVGDVAHVADADTVHFECTAQNVLQQKGAEIADVRGTVNRRAAAIHAERFFGRARRERARGA